MLPGKTHIRAFLAVSLLGCLLRPAALTAQYIYNNYYEGPLITLEGGIQLGIMNSITDLGGNPRVYQGPAAGYTFRSSSFAGGLYGTATYKDAIGLRLDVTRGRVQNYDSTLKNATAPSAIGRFERNLHFRSQIFEIGVGLELHPIMLFNYQDRPAPRLSPYAIGGMNWFRFNPKAEIDGRWVELAPLRLEGQGFAEYPDRQPYKLHAFSLGLGFGFRYDLSERIVLRAEMIERTTFTDYLDDVSREEWIDPNLFINYLTPDQAALARRLYNRSPTIDPPRNTRPRGNSSENDVIWTLWLRAGFNINRNKSPRGVPRSLRGGIRCPRI